MVVESYIQVTFFSLLGDGTFFLLSACFDKVPNFSRLNWDIILAEAVILFNFSIYDDKSQNKQLKLHNYEVQDRKWLK